MIKTLSLTSALLLAACGGGGSNPPYAQVGCIPDMTISNKIGLVNYTNPDHNFYKYANVSFNLISNGYFANNRSNSHAAIVMRTNLDSSSTYINGVGMVFGDVSRATFNEFSFPNQLTPSVQIETWFNGIDPGNYLLKPLNTPPILEDDVVYKISITSNITANRQQTIQTVVIDPRGVVWDSGVLVDPNKYLEQLNNGLAVGHVFQNPDARPWTLSFYNIRLTLSNGEN